MSRLRLDSSSVWKITLQSREEVQACPKPTRGKKQACMPWMYVAGQLKYLHITSYLLSPIEGSRIHFAVCACTAARTGFAQ